MSSYLQTTEIISLSIVSISLKYEEKKGQVKKNKKIIKPIFYNIFNSSTFNPNIVHYVSTIKFIWNINCTEQKTPLKTIL